MEAVKSMSETKNTVLAKTYNLLSYTLIWSAVVAMFSMYSGLTNVFTSMGMGSLVVMLIGYFGMLFAIEKTKNSGWGLFWTFGLTGFLGLTISPLLQYAIGTGNSEAIFMSLGGTGLIFLLMSAYGRTTKKDLSGWLPLIFWCLLGAFVVSIINVIFFNVSMLALVISAAFMILSAMLISAYTQQIVNGGETNYISATVLLFVAIYNIFSSLLQILLAFTGDE
tara:strand:+ start:31119 stop:31787 length:669 start_codon:yes stop_codon:yes gene_type:complete